MPLLANPWILLLAACFASAATFALIGVILPWLRRRAMAQVTHRSSHAAPTPQSAGLAVVAVTLLTCAALLIGGWVPASPGPAIAVLALGSVLLCAVGFADDIGELSARVRFLAQAAAVVAVIAVLPAQPRLLPPWLPLGLERAALAFAGLWFVNLFNFMDGIDWITFVETTAVTAGIVLLWRLGLAGETAGAIALVLGAATAGFAIWNRPRAAVFLGDAGSLPMGLILVWLMIDTALRGAWAAAVLFSLYYWADATLTLLRRLVRRERVWAAHRTHFYQQATRPGRHGVPRTLAAIAATNAGLVALGVAAELTGSLAAKVVAIAVGAAAVVALLRFLWDPRDSG